MSGYKSQKDLLKEIQSTLDQLDNGQLTIEELENHISNVRELYERAIVLRYKAFEEKVGLASMVEEEIEEVKEEVIEETIEEAAPEIEEEPQMEAIQEEEQPAFDFSIFDNPAEKEMAANTELETEEHISISHTSEVKDGIHEDKTSIEATVETIIQPESSNNENSDVVSSNSDEFDARFKAIEATISGQIGFNKLDSLVGSFGLNERLQFINELFDGSSESFSDAIKSLDTQNDLGNAKGKLANYANQNQWDLESDTVEEFIQKVCRRYA